MKFKLKSLFKNEDNYLRFKYKLKSIFTPMCWIRNGRTNSEWDRFLWTSLINNKIEFIGECEAIINGCVVWHENAPYASGRYGTFMPSPKYCSRATALYLRDELEKELIIQRLKGPYNELEIFEKYEICL